MVKSRGWRTDTVEMRLTVQKGSTHRGILPEAFLQFLTIERTATSRDFERFRNYVETAVSKLIPQLLGEN